MVKYWAPPSEVDEAGMSPLLTFVQRCVEVLDSTEGQRGTRKGMQVGKEEVKLYSQAV